MDLGKILGAIGGGLAGGAPGALGGAFGGPKGAMAGTGLGSLLGLMFGGDRNMGQVGQAPGLSDRLARRQGYTSGDGLINIPDLSPEDALDGFRSVLDFRHIYGPDTKVPDINFGGQRVSGKVGAPNPFEQMGPYNNYLNRFGG